MRTVNLKYGSSFCRLRRPVCIWLLGFLLGVLLAVPVKSFIFSMMLRVIRSPMSIDGLLTAYFLPFLIAATAFRFRFKSFLLSVCFIKAFSFGYLACALVQCISFGWLVLPLFFFSDFVVGFLLLRFCAVFDNKCTNLQTSTSAVLITAAAGIDYLWIAPFLSAIVN